MKNLFKYLSSILLKNPFGLFYFSFSYCRYFSYSKNDTFIESLSSVFLDGPRKTLMNHGIRPPKTIVVKKTINKTVLFMMSTAIYYYYVAPFGGYTVKINAKATDPLIVPAVEMIAI